MALEQVGGGRHHLADVRDGASDAPVGVWEVGEEPLGAALHDGEQDPVLGSEVVVDGALVDARFGDHAG